MGGLTDVVRAHYAGHKIPAPKVGVVPSYVKLPKAKASAGAKGKLVGSTTVRKYA